MCSSVVCYWFCCMSVKLCLESSLFTYTFSLTNLGSHLDHSKLHYLRKVTRKGLELWGCNLSCSNVVGWLSRGQVSGNCAICTPAFSGYFRYINEKLHFPEDTVHAFSHTIVQLQSIRSAIGHQPIEDCNLLQLPKDSHNYTLFQSK